MTPEVHRRFLEYLELRGYFARGPDNQALEQEEFARLDAEYELLTHAKLAGNIDAPAHSRLVELQRTLHRD